MTNRFPRLAGVLLSCAALPVAPSAWAQTVHGVDIPAEPLSRALAAFTRATGVIVVADADLVRGLRSAPVHGASDARTTLDQLLQGTGLRARSDGRSGYVLVRQAQPVPADAEAAPAAPAPADILVFGRLTKDTMLTIPQSVDVIGSQTIENARADTVGEALRFIPGASRNGSSLDAFGDDYLIRGFLANQTVNGIYNSTMRQPRDTIGIERIEVLKGPASVLYGQLQPGAVVNIVTKQPTRDWRGSASVSFGRFDEWRVTTDISGPLTTGGNVRFRVTGAYDDADSFVDYWHRRHSFIAPVLAFDVGDATTVTLEGVYTRTRYNGFFNGLPAEGTVLPNPNGRLARSLGLTDPTFAPTIRDDSDISARVEHRFSDTVRWRTALAWTHEHRNEEDVLGLLGWEGDDKRLLQRAVLNSVSSGDTWTAHTDLGFALKTGALSHELVIGGDYTWFDRYTTGSTSLAPSLDVFAPVYDLTARPTLIRIARRDTTAAERNRTAGLFAQDRISITDKIKVIGGVRWSDFRQSTVSTRGAAAATTRAQSQTAWTSQVGLLYMPTPSISLFANRTSSFLPVAGVDASGAALKPETGTQYEVGAKAVLIDGRLTLDGALFDLKRGDVAVADRVTPGALIAIGGQKARGFELSATARPVDGFTLRAAYTYLDAKTTQDTDVTLIGKRIRNVPAHGAVLVVDYALPDGMLSGLSLGGSATYSGNRAGDDADSFTVPDYWRVDLHADYALTDHLNLGVSVENVGDKRYYEQSSSLFELYPAAPRTWRATLRARF
jgi:iron complex outermembrane receptor protein